MGFWGFGVLGFWGRGRGRDRGRVRVRVRVGASPFGHTETHVLDHLFTII